MIFNADRNAKVSDYNVEGKILVHHIFHTIQGEGPFSGMAATFVRLAGCNRGAKTDSTNCSFCDTEFFFAKGTWMTTEEIAAQCRHSLVVVTGGEPGLQARELRGLRKALPFKSIIQYESNGDWDLNPLYGYNVHMVISPKGEAFYKKTPERFDNVSFKFLIQDKPGLFYDLPEWASGMLVFVSPITAWKKQPPAGAFSLLDNPEYIDLEQTKRNVKRATDLVLEHGHARLSMQAHLFFGLE